MILELYSNYLSGFSVGAGWHFNMPANLTIVLNSISESVPSVTAMITSICYVAGFWFLYKGVYKLKQYGELRTMMSSNTDMGEVIKVFVAGTLLLFIPTTINVFESTLFGSYVPHTLCYQCNSHTVTNRYEALAQIVIIVVRIFGLIAFVRGCMMLASAGQNSNPNSSLGKALTHIVGGALLINLHATVSVFFSTIGGSLT